MDHSKNKLKRYLSQELRPDLLASLTLLTILVPQAMAYALLAGLSPIYGLFTALVPPLVYALLGRSSFLALGPVALMAIIVYTGLSPLAVPGSEEYLSIVMLAGFLAGLIQIGFSLAKLGVIAHFLSKPVTSAFIAAAGIIIIISQLSGLLGLSEKITGSYMADLIRGDASLPQVNVAAMIIGIVCLSSLILLRKWKKQFPAGIILVVLGILVVWLIGLVVPVIGVLPEGLPSLQASFLSWSSVVQVFPTALAISIICFIGSYAIASQLQDPTEKPIHPDRELLALGASKMIGSFFQAFPSTGSFSRSTVVRDAGGRTRMTAVWTIFALGGLLLFGGQLFIHLPKAILAAIIILSGISLIDLKYPRFLYTIDRSDFWVWVITFTSTLTLGIVNGVFVGMICSLITVLIKDSRLDYAVLGRLTESGVFRNIGRYTDTVAIPNTLILRFSQPLFFANAHQFRNIIHKEATRIENLQNIIVSYPCYSVPDGSAASMFLQLCQEIKEGGYRLIFTDLNGPIRDFLHRTGIYKEIGVDNFFLNVKDAVTAVSLGQEEAQLSNKYSRQTNIPG